MYCAGSPGDYSIIGNRYHLSIASYSFFLFMPYIRSYHAPPHHTTHQKRKPQARQFSQSINQVLEQVFAYSVNTKEELLSAPPLSSYCPGLFQHSKNHNTSVIAPRVSSAKLLRGRGSGKPGISPMIVTTNSKPSNAFLLLFFTSNRASSRFCRNYLRAVFVCDGLLHRAQSMFP